ncbi:hypothetical protein [Alkalibacillus almallahensis]|uniref:hypothetical protein n=1 Tax=Alkalibacillus almallahensis TaxID=1379154 RepID=UPI00141F8A0C|nr:hypothetical protein [Alkalibacillus almallahensis]NIK11811.1 hypothetical protein [Alkalibacillus almallahensis]
MKNYDSLEAFKYGFLISEELPSNPEKLEGWSYNNLSNYHIYSHPSLKIQTIKTKYGHAVIIGDIFVAKGNKSIHKIINKLINKEDWDAFDKLSGRFAIFLISKSSAKVLHDPFGSRTIYYRQEESFGVSSHSTLLAEAFNESIDENAKSFIKLPEYAQRGTGYLPGDATMYKNIKLLVPNNYYDVCSRNTVRYWPRKPIKKTSFNKFLKECDEYFQNFNSYVNKHYSLLLGLTGGVDSRALIAGLNQSNSQIRLITWSGKRLPESEFPIVENMKSYLDLPHFYMDPSPIPDSENFQKYRNLASVSTGYSRGGSILTGHMSELNFLNNEVFVRGWGGEIIRGFYNRHNQHVSNSLSEDFFQYYKGGKLKNPSYEFESFTRQAIQGFISRGNYDKELFNIDVRDLYYWEQRMGTWGANMLNELDPVIYSLIGLNSRPLFEKAFGLKEDERLGKDIMINITKRYDVKLAKMGVVS